MRQTSGESVNKETRFVSPVSGGGGVEISFLLSEMFLFSTIIGEKEEENIPYFFFTPIFA